MNGCEERPSVIWVWDGGRVHYISEYAEPALPLINPDPDAAKVFASAESAWQFVRSSNALKRREERGEVGVFEICRQAFLPVAAWRDDRLLRDDEPVEAAS